MSWARKNRIDKGCVGQYASSEEFRKVFTEELEGLYLLALLLTGDRDKAKQCFVGGLEDCVRTNHVFREWARSWTKRAIITNAIRALQPHPGVANASWPALVFHDKGNVADIPEGHFELQSVSVVDAFERFVFVMSVLEQYRDHDCAVLLRCSIQEIREARVRAFQKLAGCNRTSSAHENLKDTTIPRTIEAGR
jgi:DNA-directed RNA polymerase specialized sigma24 family protein